MTTNDRYEESESELVARAAEASGEVGVRRVDNLAELRGTLNTAITNAREAFSMLPAGPYPIEVMRSTWDTEVASIRRGTILRGLYQADATRTPEILRYLGEFVRAGAQARITPRITHRTMIFDRTLVVVAVDPDTLRRPYLVIREPALVRNFHDQFARVWRDAHSVGIGPEDPLEETRVRKLLEILAKGETDDYAAKELKVSARTIRRRMAAIMVLLGASSRFEAGVKAVKTGWL
jgi:hypothetical protein